jgi:hypothetical protein
MSKGHQANRRRTYGRRQHDMNEMRDHIFRQDGSSSWVGASIATETKGGWGAQFAARHPSDTAFLRGVD